MHDQSILINLGGAALESNVQKATLHFQEALASNKDVVIDLSHACQIDARFLGLLLMLRKELRSRGAELRLTAVPKAIASVFRLNELGFLLSADSPGGRIIGVRQAEKTEAVVQKRRHLAER